MNFIPKLHGFSDCVISACLRTCTHVVSHIDRVDSRGSSRMFGSLPRNVASYVRALTGDSLLSVYRICRLGLKPGRPLIHVVFLK